MRVEHQPVKKKANIMPGPIYKNGVQKPRNRKKKPLDAVTDFFHRCCQRLSHGLKGVFQNIALELGSEIHVSFGPDYQK